jgi:hypothetical protein
MSQNIADEIRNIKFILNTNISTKEKYFQIKSLEMKLLEYLVCKENFVGPARQQLINAAQFISSYFLTDNVWNQFEKYEIFVSFTLATLDEILNSNEKSLDGIRGFRVYEIFYSNFIQALVAV